MKTRLAFLLVLPTVLLAQEFPTRAGDVRFDPAGLVDRLSGRDLFFYDNGRSRYYDDGRYSYTFDGDTRESAGGYWTVTEQGVVCVAFITGHSRCDLFVLDGDQLVLIDAKGGRYPVRP